MSLLPRGSNILVEVTSVVHVCLTGTEWMTRVLLGVIVVRMKGKRAKLTTVRTC